jgi:hypothetical protein
MTFQQIVSKHAKIGKKAQRQKIYNKVVLLIYGLS